MCVIYSPGLVEQLVGAGPAFHLFQLHLRRPQLRLHNPRHLGPSLHGRWRLVPLPQVDLRGDGALECVVVRAVAPDGKLLAGNGLLPFIQSLKRSLVSLVAIALA